jgi:hypothetical protein
MADVTRRAWPLCYLTASKTPMRIHLTELEYLVSDAEVERYNEMFNNDELHAQLAEKDKQHLEQKDKIKEMEEKFETQEK